MVVVDVVKVGIGPGCFRSDTRILMADGTYENISEIQVGSYVINRNGSPVKVLNKFNKGIRNLIKIRTNNGMMKHLLQVIIIIG